MFLLGVVGGGGGLGTVALGSQEPTISAGRASMIEDSQVQHDASLSVSRADAEARFVMLFAPRAHGVLASNDVLVAEYRQQIHDADGVEVSTVSTLILYDPVTRANAMLRSFDGHLVMTDANGDIWRGRIGDPAGIVIVGRDDFPIDDSRIEMFVPSVFLRDILDRPDILVDAGDRPVPLNDDSGHRLLERPGAFAVVSLPAGERYMERRLPVSGNLNVEVHIDWAGRVVSKRVQGATPTKYLYSDNSPPGFPLVDPAHGGAWRLANSKIIHNPDVDEIFTPEFIIAFAADWGIPEPLTRFDP